MKLVVHPELTDYRLEDSGVIQIWFGQLNVIPDSAFSLLSDNERGRMMHMGVARALEFGQMRVMLRACLALALGQPPHLIAIESSDSGKPYISGSRCHLSYAHCQGRAVLVLLNDGPVGVDLERVVSRPRLNAFSRRYFDLNTVNLLETLTEDARHETFFREWVRREAIAKYIGQSVFYCLGSNRSLAALMRVYGCELVDIETDEPWICSLATPRKISRNLQKTFRFDAALASMLFRAHGKFHALLEIEAR